MIDFLRLESVSLYIKGVKGNFYKKIFKFGLKIQKFIKNVKFALKSSKNLNFKSKIIKIR